QCKPRPDGLMMKSARSSALARIRRGNHASGAPIVRPSARSTHKVSSSQRTALAEMLMPRSLDLLAARFNGTRQFRQFAPAEPWESAKATSGQARISLRRRLSGHECEPARASFLHWRRKRTERFVREKRQACELFSTV